MKKFLFLVMAFSLILAGLPSQKASAQFKTFTFDKTACTAAADTATGDVNAAYSAVTSLTFSVTKVSGTVAGKVYVYVSNVGNTYSLVDSATVTNTTGTKDYTFNSVSNATQFPVGSPQWYKYRFYYLQTGGSTTIAGRQLLRGVAGR